MAGPKFEPSQVRQVLAYLREHPWSSREDMKDALGIGTRTLLWIIENECHLRTEKQKPAKGGPERLCYALPELRGR